MAVEGQADGVIDGGVPPPAGAEKPKGGNGEAEKKAAVTGAQPDKTRDYDREIAGFKADLIKERKARQQYESDLAAAKAETAAERKRVQALAGLEPKSESEVEEAAIRARLEALGYPRLSKEDLEAIKENRAALQNMQQTQEHYWVQHGRQMVSGVYEAVEKELGGKLSERQQQRILAEYVRTMDSDPQLAARHEQGDKTLITEFAKQLAEDWFEPARRKVTQQETQRFRAVPSGKDRGIVTHGEKKIDVNDPKAVEDLLVKGFRERNGDFSGRR